MLDQNIFRLSQEVHESLIGGRAVVALESTVIAHGLPRPHNLKTAQRMEEIVRAAGAAPATIAVLDGRFHIGLGAAELSRVANSESIRKISTRDLPAAIGRGWDGATTVATSLWVAHRVGLEVFATGGIGGVHRGTHWDVSADLPELARCSKTTRASPPRSAAL